MKKILKGIKHPSKIFDQLARIGLFKFIDDKKYLNLKMKIRMGRGGNFETPETFNEKLQWLKLNDRRPEYTQMVDKYEAKKYVSNIIGDEYIIPTLGVWNHFDEIDFGKLPNQFVLKCTHDSGGLVIVKDKEKLDKASARKKLERSLKRNYYWSGREWPYKDVPPRIIAEEYLENDQDGLNDYKIWCFNGKPVFIQYITGRIAEKIYEGFYNLDWKLQEFSYHNPIMEEAIEKPKCLDELVQLAKALSQDKPFVRCDFYVLEDGTIRFGEITFYPMGGNETWKPENQDLKMGELIDLNYGRKS